MAEFFTTPMAAPAPVAAPMQESALQESALSDGPGSLAAAVLTDDNRLIVIVVAVVAVAALVVARLLVRQVLA
ncbi:hypothetical protein G3M55_51785, partial [Streptomyces sp. SID8455]|nr:hypothetical protein [Streptomyces sp. SID8455]